MSLPPLVRWEYDYDAVHNRIATTISDPQFRFDLAQLAPASFTADEMNQYTSATVGAGSPQAFVYDANGNLEEPLENAYTFDSENRLVSASTLSGGVARYEYDASGLRVSKAVDGTKTEYVLDGNRVLEEWRNGTRVRRYLYAGGDVPFRSTGGGPLHYFHQDGLGSVVALSTGGSSLVEGYAYGPYGEPVSASAVGNPFRYTGREYDAETGLYYYRARHYDPSIGRFLQPDPLGYGDGLNVYAYVGGNPINLIDPLGLFATANPAGSRLGAQSFEGIPSEFRGAFSERFETFRSFVSEQGAATLTLSGALNRRAGLGAAVSISSDPRFENFTIDSLGGVGIGFGTSLTASVGLGGSRDVGVALIGTAAIDQARFLPEPGVFAAVRAGQASFSGSVGAGAGEGTGVVLGVSPPGINVTRQQLVDFLK